MYIYICIYIYTVKRNNTSSFRDIALKALSALFVSLYFVYVNVGSNELYVI